MGGLRELLSENKTVHMLISQSGIIDMYVYDKLKERCSATLDSVVEIESKSQFKELLDLVNIQPYMADKWLFKISYSKFKSDIKKNMGIFQSDSACFLISVRHYGDYKEFKELFPSVNDMYLSFIRKSEVQYLLYGYSLSEKLIEFVAKSYIRDPEKVFLLKQALDDGKEVKDRKGIVKICGTGSGSVQHLAIQLLKDFPDTERGLQAVYRNRVKSVYELSQAYSMSSIKNFLTATVKDIICIKDLYMNGVIYNTIRGLPESYDEKKLSKYNFYLETIISLPYTRVMNLYIKLKQSKAWRSDIDMLEFMYNYYGGGRV